jgi:hypothetical protein
VVPEIVDHFIGGQRARSSCGKTFGAADPATGREYARVAVGLAADVNHAVRAGVFAYETGPWPGLPAAERAGVLDAIADAIDARAAEIAGAEALGTGLPVTQAAGQAVRAAEQFRRAARLVPERPASDLPIAPGLAGTARPASRPGAHGNAGPRVQHSSPPSLRQTSSASSATATWWSGRRSRARTAWRWNSNGGGSWKPRTASGPATAPAGTRSRAT